MKRLVLIGAALVLLGSVPASAHHSLSAYNRSTYKTVEGTVKQFQWTNPHARLTLTVDEGNGPAEWNFEGGSINRLVNSGFARNTIAPGDKITVAYNPMRNGATGGFFLAVTTSDGTIYGRDRLSRFKPGR